MSAATLRDPFPAEGGGATAAIAARGLVKRFGRTVALDGLSMTVPRGEVFGFLGPNGAGKTTAVKLLLGLSRPTAGDASVLGRPLGDVEARRRIGYLPELFRYQAWLSGREVLALHAALAGTPRGERARAIDEALALVGLGGRGDDRVGGYSKGMQQRLGLGAALLGHPELVFLDEPTSALDPVGRMEMRPIIRTLKATGTTVFLNSHLLTEVEQVCDRVAIVSRGRVVALGTLDELLAEQVVRLRLAGFPPERRIELARFGAFAEEGEWLVVHGLATERIPELVEPVRASLEERFSELVTGDGGTEGIAASAASAVRPQTGSPAAGASGGAPSAGGPSGGAPSGSAPSGSGRR